MLSVKQKQTKDLLMVHFQYNLSLKIVVDRSVQSSIFAHCVSNLLRCSFLLLNKSVRIETESGTLNSMNSSEVSRSHVTAHPCM